MRGTGRYNLAQGAVATTQGVGASISALAAGEVRRSFRLLDLVSHPRRRRGLAFLVFFAFMPETRDEQASARDSKRGRSKGRRRMTPESIAALVDPGPDLCRRRRRPHSRPAARSRRHRVPRRRGDDRARTLKPRGRLPRHRFQHDRAAPRHDDRRRAPQGFGRLSRAWRARHRPRPRAVRAARHGDRRSPAFCRRSSSTTRSVW